MNLSTYRNQLRNKYYQEELQRKREEDIGAMGNVGKLLGGAAALATGGLSTLATAPLETLAAVSSAAASGEAVGKGLAGGDMVGAAKGAVGLSQLKELNEAIELKVAKSKYEAAAEKFRAGIINEEELKKVAKSNKYVVKTILDDPIKVMQEKETKARETAQASSAVEEAAKKYNLEITGVGPSGVPSATSKTATVYQQKQEQAAGEFATWLPQVKQSGNFEEWAEKINKAPLLKESKEKLISLGYAHFGVKAPADAKAALATTLGANDYNKLLENKGAYATSLENMKNYIKEGLPIEGASTYIKPMEGTGSFGDRFGRIKGFVYKAQSKDPKILEAIAKAKSKGMSKEDIRKELVTLKGINIAIYENDL